MAAAVSRKSHRAVVVGARHEAPVIVEHRGNDAGRAVRGRGHHAAARGVLLVHGERVEVHPVHDDQRVASAASGSPLSLR